MKRAVQVVLWMVGFVFIVALLEFLGVVGGCSYSYWWDRDQWNQEKIAKAYISFYTDKTNFPGSLEELVKAGYLPEKAEWYKEPPGKFRHPVDFRESSYVVRPPKSNDVENLDMIGYRRRRDGKEDIEFGPTINADVRDAIKQRTKSAPPGA